MIFVLRPWTIGGVVGALRRISKNTFTVSSCTCNKETLTLPQKRRKRVFVDKARVLFKGGSGGMGYTSTGGIGGNGGAVVLESKQHASLSQFTTENMKRITGALGENCRKAMSSGKNGITKKFYVPTGTIVTCTEDGFLADLDKQGQTFTLVKGGIGGRHFNNFCGQKGERRHVVLELKSIADIGLVGYPNAGKSTFLCNISKAKPRIGHYPFTTLRPTIGSIFYEKSEQITVADLPGLIEGAHMNRGMGHRFLRHVERTKGLLILVDVNGFQLKENAPIRTPLQTLCHLLKELYLYENALLNMPVVVALNKVDDEQRLPHFYSAKKSIMNASEAKVEEILQDKSVVEPVYKKLREICDNSEIEILKTSTKFGVGLSQLRDYLYDITFCQDAENDEDHEENEDNLEDSYESDTEDNRSTL